ncbi:MAG: regulator of protease activity HflC (stomatin/prohibitin superfamily) [Saprospiraceae bacterium]|jgi:regulator of protease activity HflC (stomatin/prohibitin superfamily)
MKQFSMKQILFSVGVIIIMVALLSLNPFSTNESGYRQQVRTLSGTEYVRFEPGFYFSGFFSAVTSYPDVITVQYGAEDEEGDDVTFFAPPHGVRFNGGDNARIGHTVKWDLPDDEESMLGIHRHYRSHKRLASTTLSQYQKETAGYATQMLDSETHYSGGQSQLKEFFQDQLRNGQVLLDKKQKVLTDSITMVAITVIEVKPRKDKDGNSIRTPSDIQKYNITPSFVSIDHVKYDDLIEEKLKAKIESATIKSISEQKLITAQQEALTAVEDGKKQLAQVTATKEAEKLEAVIEAEKQTAISAELAKQARYNAEKTIAEGRADAEVAKLKVMAGLSPLDKATFDKETSIGVAAELAKMQFPKMMVIGGSGQNGQPLDPFQAVGLESFIKISKSLSEN